MKETRIFVISGPSGSGKTTLVRNILKHKDLSRLIKRSVSFTTRPKRSGEKNAKDYYFISNKEFLNFRKSKKILEWTKYLGYYYGTAKDFLEREFGKRPGIVLCLDIKGARAIKKLYPKQTTAIFVMPPSIEVLSERMKRRCLKTKDKEIKERLALAGKEIEAKRFFDYEVINDNLDLATKELRNIIIKELVHN